MRPRSILWATLLSASFALAAVADDGVARSLIERLRAPCCWQQTLDVHASPIADQLRHEIHERVDKGESVAAIEQDLVTRYGERIRAIPTEGFLTPLGVFGLMAAVLGLIFTLAMGFRLSRRSSGPSSSPAPAGAVDADEAARILRAELEAID